VSGEEKGRVLGVDPGSKTIGLALSDPSRTISSALGVIKSKGAKKDLAELAKTVRENEVVHVVVGLPLHLSGAESEGSRKAREFAAMIEQELGVGVSLVDEALSTSEAEDILIRADLSRKKRKKAVDGLAAAVILKRWLDESEEEDR